jgi:hypothetical protein
MPEGLNDQDRAIIESARQSASGCLGVISVVAYGSAVLVVTVGIVVMAILEQMGIYAVPIGIIAAIVAGILWFIARAYRWIGK